MLRSLSGLVFCRFPTVSSSARLLSTVPNTSNKLTPKNIIQNQVSQNPDKLFKTIIVEVRGHDEAVLNSYEFFATFAAKELGLNLAKVWDAKCFHKRRTLLKSVFIYKKHRVQYEFRTYFRFFEFKHLTGSTADTYLEYIQRNLPEGVSMKVTKHAIEKIPDHIANFVPEKNPV